MMNNTNLQYIYDEYTTNLQGEVDFFNVENLKSESKCSSYLYGKSNSFNSEFARLEKDTSLTGEGGIFNSVNLNKYLYGGNNPIKYVDPDGEFDTARFFVDMAHNYLNDPDYDSYSYQKAFFEGYTENFATYMKEEGLYEMAKMSLRIVGNNAEYVAIVCYLISGDQTAGAIIIWTGAGVDLLSNIISDIESGDSVGKAFATELVKSGVNFAVEKVSEKSVNKLLKNSNLSREVINSFSETISNFATNKTDPYTDKTIDKIVDIFDKE